MSYSIGLRLTSSLGFCFKPAAISRLSLNFALTVCTARQIVKQKKKRNPTEPPKNSISFTPFGTDAVVSVTITATETAAIIANTASSTDEIISLLLFDNFFNSNCFNLDIVVGVYADFAGDFKSSLRDLFRRKIGVLNKRARRR